MKKNITILSLNKSYANQVASLMASQLDLPFMDFIEMYKFDHEPLKLEDTIKNYGMKYYRKKEQGLVKYSSKCEGIVSVFDSGVINKKQNIEILKETSFIIFLDFSYSKLKKEFSKIKENPIIKRNFINITEPKFNTRNKKLKEISNTIIKCTNLSTLRASSLCIQSIKNSYNYK